MTVELVVGTYAEKGGKGLVPLTHDVARDEWSLGLPVAHIRNASFGVIGAQCTLLVDEAEGRIGRFDPIAGWGALGSLDTGGEAPCHVAVDEQKRWAAIANYGSGSVSLFMLADDGLRGPVSVHQNQGSGPDPERQNGPHAHWVGFSPDGSRLLCVDLGADRIFALEVDRATGELGASVDLYRAPPGSGPRHLAFHPTLPVAYLVSELIPTLTVLHRADGRLRAGTVLPLPSDEGTLGGAIAIDPAGTRLHATSRGHDSITTFALDPNGEPTPIGSVPSGGASPRHLCLLPRHLLCANEEGGTVAIFRLDGNGRPSDPQVHEVPGAAFVAAFPSRGLARKLP